MCEMLFGCSQCKHIVVYEGVIMREYEDARLVYWFNGPSQPPLNQEEAALSIRPENFQEIEFDLLHNGTFTLPCANCEQVG